MAYTLAQAVTEVRSLINEDTASYWSDTEIQSWIQQGVLDWCHKSLLYIKEDTITLSSDTIQYTTSTNSYISNAIRTIHAEYNSKSIQRVSYEQLRGHTARHLSSSVIPAYYFDQYDGTSMTFYISPTPDATINNDAITVHFACRTNDITDIPWEYQPTMFLYAAYKAKNKERQYQEGHIHYQTYINNIVFQRQDALNRGVQTIDQFRIK